MFGGSGVRKIETDIDSLVGAKVIYLRRSDVKDMAGKPHEFPRTGQVVSVVDGRLTMEDGKNVFIEELLSLSRM